VAGEPTVTLRAAMAIAADRDLVARQYAGDYREVFHLALPALRASLDAGRPVETAIVSAYLAVLASIPDTLVARKLGTAEAADVSRRAADVLSAGWPDTAEGLTLVDSFDAHLRDGGHARNPGASADLITAALFAALRDGTIALPRPPGPAGWSSILSPS
jgi:triphosphoribosyl-dephospho-CoA synthase